MSPLPGKSVFGDAQEGMTKRIAIDSPWCNATQVLCQCVSPVAGVDIAAWLRSAARFWCATAPGTVALHYGAASGYAIRADAPA